MALNSNFERWLEDKITRIKTQGGLRFFSSRDSSGDEFDTDPDFQVAMEKQGGRPQAGQNTGTSAQQGGSGSSDNYYKFVWNEGEEHSGQYAGRQQQQNGQLTSIRQPQFQMKQPSNYYSITDILDDNNSETDEFEIDTKTQHRWDPAERDLDTWDFEDNFSPQAHDLDTAPEVSNGIGFHGERELGDGHSHPEISPENRHNFVGAQTRGGGASVVGGRPAGEDFGRAVSRPTDVKFIGGQHGGGPSFQPSPTAVAGTGPHTSGGAILPMDGLQDLSMDEMDSVDSRDMEERSEMLDPELDRCESIDLDDARPIVTVDQATLLEQWKQKAKQLKLAMLAAGLVFVCAVVGLTIYLIVHFH